MKKLFVSALAGLFLIPFVSFASTDDVIRTSIVNQLLALFVQEVNGIDAMQNLIAQSSNPAQFQDLQQLLRNHLAQTQSELVNVLKPQATSTPDVPTPIPTFGSVISVPPTPTVVYVPAQPTCVLTSPKWGEIDWVSTDANSGQLFSNYRGKIDGGVIHYDYVQDLIPVNSGASKSLQFSTSDAGAAFKAIFHGNGDTSCTINVKME